MRYTAYVVAKFKLLAILLKAILGLSDEEVIEEATPLPCKLFPGPLNHRIDKDNKKLQAGDLVGGRVIELDFLHYVRIRVPSPEGGITYKTLYVNIECQWYRQGYMVERGLFHAARLRSNGLSKGQGFLDQIPVITIFTFA